MTGPVAPPARRGLSAASTSSATDRWELQTLNNSPLANAVTRGIDESPEAISNIANFTDSINETGQQILASSED